MTSTTQPVAQLLVDMPAESAARFLTLSLLEQLVMHTAPHPSAPADVSARRLDAYRSGLNRLRECITLYEDVLDGSVSPKMRRRLRKLTSTVDELPFG